MARIESRHPIALDQCRTGALAHDLIMRQFTALLCSIWLAACAAQPAVRTDELSSAPGNAAAGLRYAQQVCAECHAVAAGVTWSNLPEAPSFESIANTPGMTRLALNAWLHSPHPSMPHLIVEADRIDDLAAYLTSLKRDER